MTLWRKARTEAAGAWRSVRYDLGQTEPDAGERAVRPGAREPHPEVTSTGFHTFGGAGLTGGLRTSYGEQLIPRPRRLAAISAFGILAVAGAAGSYFAVASGVGSLAGERQAGAEPYPLAAEAPRGSEGDLANSGLGRGTANSAGRAPAAAAAPAEPATTIITVPAQKPQVAKPQPRQTTAQSKPGTTAPDGCCLNPPVPTPTVPVPTPHSPSVTPSPAASAPEDSESPEPSASPSSAEPTAQDDSAGPDEGERHRHRRH